MKKSIFLSFVTTMAICASVWSPNGLSADYQVASPKLGQISGAKMFNHAASESVIYDVTQWYLFYHAQTYVMLRVGNEASSEWSTLKFHRGQVPSDTVQFDPNTGVVTLHYSIDELSNVQQMLSGPGTVTFRYYDWSNYENGQLLLHQQRSN